LNQPFIGEADPVLGVKREGKTWHVDNRNLDGVSPVAWDFSGSVSMERFGSLGADDQQVVP
jgi:hypothetical protein